MVSGIDASGHHPLVGGVEVPGLEEETDPAYGLLAQDGGLVVLISSR